MPNFNPAAILGTLLANNPNIASNPNNRAMIDAIRQNDAQAGEQIARNLCNTYGVTPEQAISDAQRFFNLR